MSDLVTCEFPVSDYDLAATLSSGQAFRWVHVDGAWEGVIAKRWVRLEKASRSILARFVEHGAGEPAPPSTSIPLPLEGRGRPETFDIPKIATGTMQPHARMTGQADLDATAAPIVHYLQLHIDLSFILATFPDDEPMRRAVAACHGLRLLRQDPWECLASFILSSTKQIVQIQQIVAQLCERFGTPLAVPDGHPPIFSFPSIERLADCTEPDLRACKMGFRAPNLLRTAKLIASGELNLDALHAMTVDDARQQLLRCPGVGNKIANCVLLFAYGFQQAFPVDVWVMKALQQLYFPKRRISSRRLERFTATHFGPNAGYAQQYLFHYMRTQVNDIAPRRGGPMRRPVKRK